MKKFSLCLIIILGLISGCRQPEPPEIIEVDPLRGVNLTQFKNIKKKLDISNLGDSLRRTKNLYTMVFYGDYSNILKIQHQRHLLFNQARQQKLKISCSSFAFHHKTADPFWGRNFDNIETDLLLGFYFPPGKYRSITFTPLKFLGFDKGKDITGLKPVQQAGLAFAPYFMGGGVNEKGIAVGLHAVRKRDYIPDPEKQYRYVTNWQREILDNAADFDQAVNIALDFNVFDNGIKVITHNLFIYSPSGRSAILEYHSGKWQVIQNTKNWQVMTNSLRLNSGPLNCRRYSRASRLLSSIKGAFSWQESMDLLKKIAQDKKAYSTQWSVVYDHRGKNVYLCLAGNFKQIYKVGFPGLWSGGSDPDENKKKPLNEIDEKSFKPLSRKIEPISETQLLQNISRKQFTGNRLVMEGKGMDLIRLFKLIAGENNYKLEIDPAIKYKFFGRLEGPWDQILASLLKTYYLELVFDGEIMKIRKKPVPARSVKYLYTFFTILLVLIIVILIYFKKKPAAEKPVSIKKSSIHPDRIKEVSKRFSYLFEIEEIFKQDNLSLDVVAKKLMLPRHQLSQIINERFKQNFPEILNQYRIEEAKKQLLISGRQQKRILEIAFAVGFNSKAAFNRTFKKATGMTPSQFRGKKNST